MGIYYASAFYSVSNSSGCVWFWVTRQKNFWQTHIIKPWSWLLEDAMKAKIKTQSKSDWTDWDQKRLSGDVKCNNTKTSLSSACQKLEAYGRRRMNLNLPFSCAFPEASALTGCQRQLSGWFGLTLLDVLQVCIQMISSEVALGSCSKQKWCRKAWKQQRQLTILPQPWLVCGLGGMTAHPWASVTSLMNLVTKHHKNLRLPGFVCLFAF